jgi:hypothetical protein
LNNNVVCIESLSGDESILFFINDDDDAEDDRYFVARFCGNGKCIYSPLGKVILIIYNDVSNGFGEDVFGSSTIFDGNDENDVDIWWQLAERPQGLNKWRRSFWVKYGRIQ